MYPMASVKAATTYVNVINPSTGTNTVALSPSTPVGTKFTVNLTVADVNLLKSWQVNMTWNPALLKINETGATPYTGDLYAPSDHIFKYDAAPSWFGKTVNNVKGTLFWGVALSSASLPMFNGSGRLAQVRFTTVKNGTGEPTSCNLTIVASGAVRTKLITSGGALISFTAQNGFYIIPEFPMVIFVAALLAMTLVALALRKVAWPQKRWRRLIAK
jgi:hypothetical protein